MNPKNIRLILYLVIGVIGFIVLRRIGLAALFTKHGPTDDSTIYGGGGGFGGVTAPGVSPTPTGPTTQITPGPNPVTPSSLMTTPAVETRAAPGGGFFTRLAPSVARDAPAKEFTIVPATTVYYPTQAQADRGEGRQIKDPNTGRTYDPVFGEYDTAKINANAYQAMPANAPQLGDVFADGKKIGRQTAGGFFGS